MSCRGNSCVIHWDSCSLLESNFVLAVAEAGVAEAASAEAAIAKAAAP